MVPFPLSGRVRKPSLRTTLTLALTLSVEQIQRLDTVSSLDASMSGRKPIAWHDDHQTTPVA
jgi:hypothetical protein